MKILIIVIAVTFLPIAYLIALPFDDFTTLIPSEWYQLFTFIFAPLLTIISFYFVIFKTPENKNKIFTFIFGTIIFTHLNLLALSHEVPKILQFIPSKDSHLKMNVINKIKTTRNCSYSIYVLDSFYCGRICLNQDDFNNIEEGNSILLNGKKNILGFYVQSYNIQKHNKIAE